MSVLFVNACVRKNSRTKILALDYLKRTGKDVVEVTLQKEKLKPLDGKRLKKREMLIKNERLGDKFFKHARQFKNAEEIVISAPFWDLSFPSLLKIYLENVTVGGITFCYKKGVPEGLCKAKKLTYITTSGGKIFEDFGYLYVKSLAKNFYGIKDVVCIKAEDLDVKEIQDEAVLNEEIITIE